VVVPAVGVLITLVQLVLASGSLTSVVVDVVVAGVIIYYLNMPDIRKAFGAPAKGWPFIGNVGS
jgi:hypothetical protein